MTAVAARPSLANPDVTQARLIARTWDPEERGEYLVASIPSRRDAEVRYRVEGHTHGRDARCSCLGFARWRRCAHAAAFILIVEELERQFWSQPEYSTARLIELLDYYARIPDILSDEQRLRRNGIRAALADRGVRYEAYRTLAEQAELVARGKRAARDLFEEG